MNEMIILLTVAMLPLFIAIILTPYLTRKTESFGVSIPEEVYHDEKLIKMRKAYVLMISLVSIITTIIFLFVGSLISNDENTVAIVFSSFTFLYLGISFLVFLYFHKKMKHIKQDATWVKEKSVRVVIDTTFRNQKLTYSNFWFIIAFAITIATVFVTLSYYQQIPAKIPMNYNFFGEVTNWATKSYKTVLIMPITQVYLILMFIGINTIIAKAKQQVSAENPEDSMKRNVIFRKRWSGFLIISGIATTLLLAIVQLSFIFPISGNVLTLSSIIFTGGILSGAIGLAITTGQGGSRLKTEVTKDGTVIDRDDDQFWKLGMFYCNKNDPSIFLEKRFGIGWTNNWAHPLSWIILISFIIIGAGLPLLLMM